MIQPMSLSTIAALCQGRVYGEDVAVSSVEIDSRRSRDQSLFVALPGKHVDGHNFIDAAAENGAAAALVNTTDYIAKVLVLADIAWKPNDNEMENVSFEEYDWKI